MWICLNNAFLSIVQHWDKPNVLIVRARREGDIERVFPNTKTWVDPNADYQHRAEVPREIVAAKLVEAVGRIDYPNFKGSVREPDLHDAYMGVWHTLHHHLDNRGGSAIARRRRAGRPEFDFN